MSKLLFIIFFCVREETQTTEQTGSSPDLLDEVIREFESNDAPWIQLRDTSNKENEGKRGSSFNQKKISSLQKDFSKDLAEFESNKASESERVLERKQIQDVSDETISSQNRAIDNQHTTFEGKSGSKTKAMQS